MKMNEYLQLNDHMYLMKRDVRVACLSGEPLCRAEVPRLDGGRGAGGQAGGGSACRSLPRQVIIAFRA